MHNFFLISHNMKRGEILLLWEASNALQKIKLNDRSWIRFIPFHTLTSNRKLSRQDVILDKDINGKWHYCKGKSSNVKEQMENDLMDNELEPPLHHSFSQYTFKQSPASMTWAIVFLSFSHALAIRLSFELSWLEWWVKIWLELIFLTHLRVGSTWVKKSVSG